MTTRKKAELEQSLVIADESIQTLIDAFNKVLEQYHWKEGRKPTLAEWEKLIVLAMEQGKDQMADDLDEQQVSSCKLRKKKIPKRKTTRRSRSSTSDGYKPGDLFAIPIIDKLYGYGKIVRGDQLGGELYVELYSIFSKRVLKIKEFEAKEAEPFLTCSIEWSPILSGQWKRVGTLPFDETNYQLPDFYGYVVTFFGNSRLYYISKGKANDPEAREYGVSEAEALSVRNPDGLFNHDQLVEWLYQEFLRVSSLS